MQDKRNTESVVQEIMGLVDTLVASVNEANLAKRKDWRDACFQSADNLIVAIESKLRELVESKPSVREPLSVQEIERESLHEQFRDGVRFAEREHNIF